MAEWFVGPIMDTLINTCSEYLQNQFRSQTRMKEELERLRENHPKIQAVVFAASQAQIGDRNPALNKWLWQLRDAIDEADDLLDEFQYMKHKEQLSKNMEETKVRSATTSFLFETARKLRKVGERALKIDPNLKRLEEVVQKLDKVSAEVVTFLHLLESTKLEQQEQQLEFYKIRETGSLPKNDLIGRSEDKEFVMQWLRQPSNEEHPTHITGNTLFCNISLLSIVGHGGMGKTTLLQHVYEDEMTKEFDLKMWVCVSNNFDAKKVIADMLEYLKKERPRLESISTLQETLKSAVQFKKFLLVLDDIWDEDEERDKSKLENVLAPLAYGSLGSKILVTTRIDSVAAMMAKVIKKKKEMLRLKGLKEDKCLQLLNTHAFANVENLDDHKKLRSIAGEMVSRLSGSPLAAKIIGGVLNSSMDERHWNTILNSDFKCAEFGQNDILPILKLSYMFLPKSLQNCFAFCGIFPQDHEFHKDDLVRMWIAVGFIQSSFNSEETMEDIGGRYFDILVKKSFFDKFEYEARYKMHDLLLELAQSIFTLECFRVVSDEELFCKIPKTIHHLYVETGNLEILKKMVKFKNLRSLYLTYEKDDQNDQDFIEVFTEIFEASRGLRLLHINVPYLKVMPEAIGCLIHLRYLNIYRTSVDFLPRSLSNLYHMEFIISSPKPGLDNFLPKDLNNLSNLHYLELPDTILKGIHGIGKLISLQNLNEFCVKNENGYRIGELEHMNDLCLLRIKLLENVENAAEAYNAKLCDKRNLMDLSLDWGLYNASPCVPTYDYERKQTRQNIADPDLDERVLDNLQPHKNLKKLKIIEYMGVRPAIWMNKAHLIYNLEYIELNDCLEWQTFPPFGQLPFLKSLLLYNMPKVQRLDNKFHGNDNYCVFPSLEMLHIEGSEALEDWFEAGVVAEGDCLFPRLTNLYLKDCPNLQELPYLPPMLKMLMIKNVGWKTLNCCSISNSIPLELETLDVSRCPNMTYIHLADEIARLTALRYLTILHCPNLISLGVHQEAETTEKCQLILMKVSINDPSVLLMEPLRSFTSIETLEIIYNDKLVSFSIEAEQWFLQVSSSLCKLYFSGLQSLQSLSLSLESLSSLKTIIMYDVPQVQLLPNIPISLERLKLDGLKSLWCLPSLSTISSLKYLDLTDIPLKSLPDLPPSLCKLVLISLKNLDCLPSCLPSLSSLTIITIYDVPQLRELPDLPPSLKRLSIKNCHSELKERYEKFSGPYWHKLAHIPHVDISIEQHQQL